LAYLVASGGFVPCVHATRQSCEQLAQLALTNAKDHVRADRRGRSVYAATGSNAVAGRRSILLQATASILPRDGRGQSDRGFGHKDRSVDAHEQIEQQISRPGQRRVRREIDYHALGLAIAQGYASAATDTGHAAHGTDATWALGHPEKIIDDGYRAIHNLTLVARATALTSVPPTATPPFSLRHLRWIIRASYRS